LLCVVFDEGAYRWKGNTSSSSNPFSTKFIALQSILAQKDALKAMVTSKDWTSSAYAKVAKAKRFMEQVLDSRFWKACAEIVKLTKPLMRVLRIVDNEDKLVMRFLYQAMYKAREEMLRRFQRNKKKVKPYLEILDHCWDSQLRGDFHAIVYWLNLGCCFNDQEFEKHMNTTSAFYEVLEKYSHGNLELNCHLTSEIRLY